MTFIDYLLRLVDSSSDKTAITYLSDDRGEGESLTYGQLINQSSAIAGSLGTRSTPGGRVVIMVPSGLNFSKILVACFMSGRIAVPVYVPKESASWKRFRKIICDASPDIIISDFQSIERIRKFCNDEERKLLVRVEDLEIGEKVDLRTSEIAFLQYTSGSTGDPKGVIITHTNLLANQRRIHKIFKQNRDSVVVNWLPLFHDMGLVGGLLHPLFLGARCILLAPAQFIERPESWLNAMNKYRGSISGGPNFAYDHCIESVSEAVVESLDLSSWNVAFNGAETVRKATMERFSKKFERAGFRKDAFCPCYGMAESTLMITGVSPGSGYRSVIISQDQASRQEVEIVSSGPVDSDNLRVTNKLGHWASEKEVGEISIRGPSVTPGYWKLINPTTFHGTMPEIPAPFFKTGDLGFIASGELFITGRKKELIIIRGRNYYPLDIEDCVITADIECFRGCRVSAFKIDEDKGDHLVIVAEVRKIQGKIFHSLRNKIILNVVNTLDIAPHEVILVRRGLLPRTSSGKVQHHEALAKYISGAFKNLARREDEPSLDPSVEYLSVTAAKLLNLINEITPGVTKESTKGSLFSMGMDSLGFVRLIGKIDTVFNVKLTLQSLLRANSLEHLAVMVEKSENDNALATPIAVEQSENASCFPLQEEIWRDIEIYGEEERFHIPVIVEIVNQWDDVKLKEAVIDEIHRLVVENPILRCSINMNEEGHFETKPVDSIKSHISVEIAEGIADRQIIQEYITRKFDLDRPPFIRARISRSEFGTRLIFVFHHLIADGFTVCMLLGDLLNALEARAKGLARGRTEDVRREAHLPANSDRESLDNERIFWMRELRQGIAKLDLKRDRINISDKNKNKQSLIFEIDEIGSHLISEKRKQYNMSHAGVYVAGLALLIYKISRSSLIHLGIQASGRVDIQSIQRVGPLVNPLIFKMEVNKEETFGDYLLSARIKFMQILENQRLNISSLKRKLQEDESVTFATSEVFFNSLDALPLPVDKDVLEAISLSNGLPAKYDINIYHVQSNGLSKFRWEYRCEIYKKETMQFWISSMMGLLMEGLTYPQVPIGQMRLDRSAREGRASIRFMEDAL